jgi:hypothetical protein
MPAAALALLVVPLLQTPATSPLTTGTRVRVTVREANGQRTLVGPLRTFDSQTLALSSSDGPDHVALPRSSITRIEVSRGKRGHALTGFFLGAVLGLAAVALKDAGCEPDCDTEGSNGGFAVAAIGGGALLGTGVGALMRSERWESVPWAVGPPRRAGLGVLPSPGGLGVRVTLRF